MVEAEKARLKRGKVMDESFNGINVSASTAARLCPKCGTRTGFISSQTGNQCPECDPPVPGNEAFWERLTESKRLAQERLKQ
jgi:anaerobic ribonucleoside-triphosphate reductase